MEPFAYAYIVGSLVLALPVWAWLFLSRKDLRREMLLSGLLIGMLALVWEPWFLQDYWYPEYGHPVRRAIGDILYGFLVGGIASVIYAAGFRKPYVGAIRPRAWRKPFLACAILGLLGFLALSSLGIPTVHAAAAVFVAVAVLMVAMRHDLLPDALLTGAAMAVFTFLGYLIFLTLYPGIIQAWWKPSGLTGIFISGVPIEELVWAFAFGLAAGPSYEFFAGLKYRK